jgi:hypothetical protein
VPITAANTAVDITGGGADNTSNAETGVDFFQYFSGFAYPFLQNVGGTAFSPASETRYVIIYNKTGAAAGKWGFYSYTTGNDGQKITMVNRLRATASGDAVATLGSVAWDSAVHTDAHPTGSIVIQANSKGVPIGSTIMLGASAAVRGYGKYRGQNMLQKQEGGFITERYIVSVFGQALYKDRAGRVPSVIRLDHAVSYPDLKLPTVS